MDYTKASFKYKILKTLRYVRLYGFKRTYMKILGQYHMNGNDAATGIVPFRNSIQTKNEISIVGSGNFAFTVIANFLSSTYGNVFDIAMDKNIQRANSLAKKFSFNSATIDFQDILNSESTKLVYIASNHHSHAEYAIDLIKKGVHVHIEKPHAVNQDQLIRLCQALAKNKSRCRLGFNRPHSPHFETIKDYLNRENDSAMINWFVSGHKINDDHWYFKEEEGGRVLGNLCHWTDLTYHLANYGNIYPIEITPTRGEKSDSNICVSYKFANGTIATITFSAKGHTFEGVREYLNVHKGNTLIDLRDFHYLRIDNGHNKINSSSFYRDHGHKKNVLLSYDLINGSEGESIEYIWNSGFLALETKRALELNEKVLVNDFKHYQELYSL